nr:hypothetical protein [Jiangella anatolica]
MVAVEDRAAQAARVAAAALSVVFDEAGAHHLVIREKSMAESGMSYGETV